MGFISDFIKVFKGKTTGRYIDEMVTFYTHGIPFKTWKDEVNKQRKELEDSHDDTLQEALDRQWKSIEYWELDRQEYYDLGDSPLEVLKECIGEMSTYPPPEILRVIARQFEYYMAHEGEVTLEEAFFGKPKQPRKTYAKRVKDETFLRYKEFHSHVLSNSDISKNELVERLKNTEPVGGRAYSYLVQYLHSRRDGIENSSFLKGYNRWKTKNNISDN